MMYFTSDLHLGHQKSLQYDSRPFRNLNHMHDVLIANYKASVKANDICYFLGDVGWKEAVLEIIPTLPGKKVLIKGNHDNSNETMCKAGFDLVLNGAMINLGKSLITMTHCPLRGVWRENSISRDGSPMKNFTPGDNWHGESRHQQFSFPDFGQFHLHGHTHKWADERILDRQMDVGVVANAYRPVSFSQIESWIARYRRDENATKS